MSKKRNKRNSKKFKKKLNNRNHNGSFPTRSVTNIMSKMKQLFGKDDDFISKYQFITDFEERSEFFKKGEEHFVSNLKKMIKNKNKIYSFLNFVKMTSRENFHTVIHNKLFTPYGLFGNQTKSWYSDFHELVSGIKNYKQNKNVKELFRCMTKEEFDYVRENGVKGISWTSDMKECPMFVKKHFLSVDNSNQDEMVIVSGFFSEEDIVYDSEDQTQYEVESEFEVWLKKNSKPHNLFLVGKYNFDDFSTTMKKSIVKKLDFVRKFYRETNGICGVEMKKLLDQYQTDYRLDGIIKKMVTIDVPKYGRKLIGSKKVNLKMGSDYISKKIDYLTTGGNKMIEDFGWV